MNDNNIFIRKLYRQCMLASMLALMGGMLGRVVSTVIIGNVLEGAALSVLVITLPVQYLFEIVGSLLAVGGTIVCARLIGKGHFEEAQRAVILVYLLALGAALFLALVLFVGIDPLVRFLCAGEELFADVKRYVLILTAGNFFSMVIYLVYNLLRLDGRTGISAGVFLLMALVNIGLDLVFLLGFRMGVEAVALASVAAAAVSGGLGTVLLLAGSKNFHFNFKDFKKQKGGDIFRTARDIVALGSPNATESLCILGYTVILNRLIAGSFGISALASFKLIDSINALSLIFIYGVTGSSVQFIGVFDAEKDSKSIRQLLAQVLKWGCLFIIAYAVLCEVFAPAAAGLFGLSTPDDLAAAVSAIRIFAISLFLALINNILFCVYQGVGRLFLANVVTLSRLFIWIVLGASLLAPRIGVTGIWHSFWIAEGMTILVVLGLSFFIRRGNKYLMPVLLLDREAESKGTYKSFSVKNALESITQSSEGITEFCKQNHLSSKLTMALSLAIEEILVVIHVHCLRRETGNRALPGDEDAVMNVRVLITEEAVVLRIRNGGRYFNPMEYVKEAGESEEVMGIKMILALAQTMDYRNTFGINNTTILLRREESAVSKQNIPNGEKLLI